MVKTPEDPSWESIAPHGASYSARTIAHLSTKAPSDQANSEGKSKRVRSSIKTRQPSLPRSVVDTILCRQKKKINIAFVGICASIVFSLSEALSFPRLSYLRALRSFLRLLRQSSHFMDQNIRT